MGTISRGMALAGIAAFIVAAAPAAAATTFVWNGNGNFDVESQTIAPTLANQISFADADFVAGSASSGPFAHSHGQTLNFSITATIDGVDQTIYSQLLGSLSKQSLVDLGPVSFSKGTVTSVGFACDNCSGYTFHGFNSGAPTTFTLAAAGVPEPASWAMLITGFALVGLSTRRRSAAVAA